MHLDPADPDVNTYPLLNSIVVPRPIAWVSTRSAAGVGNLAPHSFFTVACVDPPLVSITSVGAKDTLRNVQETGEMVISLANRPLLERINGTSAPYDPDVDEAEAEGLEMAPSTNVSVPRVAASPASLECTLHSVQELGNSWLILGRVVGIHVDDAVMQDGHPEFELMEPLSRLGRNEWGLPNEVVRIDRPTKAPGRD
ncbi:Flavoredoxin [Nocardioides aquaticus]|uniref:Flavoredoxin n=1 Tax=Nocardioides aquaticus TaxID=160826 RepID=A0ABX8EM78_9ACTN|nr:flavin reductase family protein [Nocardioides aquaticus]QVT81627.1 Flavoredoxin [Nocardioides aquaticus]